MKKEDNYGPSERVHIEIDRYDGPREGIAEINGKLHRFKSVFSEEIDDFTDIFEIYPVGDEEYRLEKKMWDIFVEWNLKYENGEADTATHPAIKGTNARWDEINSILEAKKKKNNFEDVKTAKAKIVRIERENRYEKSGPDYLMRWLII